jgi:hypothetical protein
LSKLEIITNFYLIIKIKVMAMKKMAKVFIGDSMKGDRLEKVNDVRQNFFDKYGEYPPSFCVLSPTQTCNLRCTELTEKIWQEEYLGIDVAVEEDI